MYEFKNKWQAYSLIVKFCQCNHLCGECPFSSILLHYGKGWHCVKVYLEALKYLNCEDMFDNNDLDKVLKTVVNRIHINNKR